MKRALPLLVVIALAVGFVLFVFVLPEAADDQHATLQDAVDRTLAASSFRMTSIVNGKVTSVEEFVAPNRYRISMQSLSSGRAVAFVIIGDTLYSRVECGPRSGFTVSKGKGASGLASASYLGGFLTGSTDVRSAGSSAAGQRYTFTPQRFSSRDPAIQVSYTDAVAVVADSRLRSLTFGGTLTVNGERQSGNSRMVFSDFGRTGPIEAPPADQILPRREPCVVAPLGIDPSSG